MLDEQDLKQIRSMMEEQKEELIQRMDSQKDELIQRMDQKGDEIRSATMRDMQIILENTVMKEIRLLAEGQQLLLETLAPKSRVEALEEDVVFLKQAMRNMAQDIEKLKKAQ